MYIVREFRGDGFAVRSVVLVAVSFVRPAVQFVAASVAATVGESVAGCVPESSAG